MGLSRLIGRAELYLSGPSSSLTRVGALEDFTIHEQTFQMLDRLRAEVRREADEATANCMVMHPRVYSRLQRLTKSINRRRAQERAELQRKRRFARRQRRMNRRSRS